MIGKVKLEQVKYHLSSYLVGQDYGNPSYDGEDLDEDIEKILELLGITLDAEATEVGYAMRWEWDNRRLYACGYDVYLASLKREEHE